MQRAYDKRPRGTGDIAIFANSFMKDHAMDIDSIWCYSIMQKIKTHVLAYFQKGIY